MSEETQEVSELAETPAPEQAATAAPESENITPEEKSAELSKVFSQEEVDALIGKRLAREQRKWERQQQALKAQQPAMSAELPPPEQFQSTEQYADALATRKAEQLLLQREEQRQQAEMLETYHDLEEEARSKYDDFEQVAYNPRLPITNRDGAVDSRF
jgi:ABC-type oligopeptide transport system ATPase subunit